MTTQKKTLKHFHRDLNWSTRIYILLALALGVGAILLPSWSLIIAFALVIVLFVESLTLSIQHHPETWRRIGWALLLLLLTLLLIGGL